MYTRCPDCRTVFRINAEQLAKAQGRVRCGVCLHSFNALETLNETLAPLTSVLQTEAEPVDQIAPAEETTEAVTAPAAEEEAAEPAFTAAATTAPEIEAVTAEPAFTIAPETSESPAIESAEDITEEQPVVVGPSPSWKGPVQFDPDLKTAVIHGSLSPEDIAQAANEGIPPISTEDEGEKATAARPTTPTALPPLPDLGIIATDPHPREAEPSAPSGIKTAFWAVANLALICTLLGQYAYFERNDLVKYPELRPLLTQMCALAGCDAPLQRDVSRITMIDRVVASDPRQPNALLIDATLVNEAGFPQPYPMLEIRFSDLGNQLIAGRRFRPGEYLPAGTPVQSGMAPNKPLHITLEIVDPGKDAVSYQFEIL